VLNNSDVTVGAIAAIILDYAAVALVIGLLVLDRWLGVRRGITLDTLFALPERSSTCIVNPPALPIPLTAGGSSATACPPSTWLNFWLSRFAIAAALISALPARWLNGVKRKNSNPAAEELERVKMENPETANAS
jgi:hypothetical protein